ncbi:MAG: adenylate/guanylate cyclase domain-containing protein, partial [Desulfuromonas sp.]
MPIRRVWQHWQRGVLVGLLTVGLMLCASGLGWLVPLERLTFDTLQRATAVPGSETDRIRLILIDQASLEWGVRENGLAWPWPREVYAYIVSFCRRAEVASLTFDILYTEPSLYGVADDLAFAKALHEGPALALAAFFGEKSGSSLDWPAGLEQPFWPDLPEDWSSKLEEPSRGLLPIADLLVNDIALGNTHLQADTDGVYRRAAPFIRFASQTVPALGLAGYLSANRDAVGVTDTQVLRLAGRDVPLTADNEVILRYRGPAGTFPGYSAAAILQSELLLAQEEKPQVDPSEFMGRHVF